MSDVILGALVGYVSALILWPRHELARTQAAGSSGDARADAG
jgi:hypothetical protein